MTEQNKTTTIPLPVQGKDIDSIMQSLESGVEELFTSNRYQEFLKTMAKFHNYSFNNTMLIAMQRPDATLVTSYKNWQSMGRQVMKGEKGITIIAPAPYKKMKEKEVLDENQRPIMGTDGKPKTEQVEVTVPHVYSHILDDDRRKNAELFEEAFYEKKNLDPQMHVQQENNNTVADEVDPELLAKVLANPEMRALLNSLAKTMK